ncbi:MAG: hypothetical protein WC776_04140 [Patescibacteria group bacterium]
MDGGFFTPFIGGQMQIGSPTGEPRELGIVSCFDCYYAHAKSRELILAASIDSAWEWINGKWWPGPRRSVLVSRFYVEVNVLKGTCGMCEDWDTEREEVRFLAPRTWGILATPREEIHSLEDLLGICGDLSVRSLCDREAGTVTMSVVERNCGQQDSRRWRITPVTFKFSFENIGDFEVLRVFRLPNRSYGIHCSLTPMDSGMLRRRRGISGEGKTVEAAIEDMLHPVRR